MTDHERFMQLMREAAELLSKTPTDAIEAHLWRDMTYRLDAAAVCRTDIYPVPSDSAMGLACEVLGGLLPDRGEQP